MSKVRTVLIPDGEHELALRVVRCLAQKRSVSVHVLSSERHAPLRLSRHTSGFYPHSAHGFDRSRVEVIKETAQRIGATTILPVALPTIRLVAQHYEELSTVAALPPMPFPALLDTFADKWLLAQLLAREKIQDAGVLKSIQRLVRATQWSGIAHFDCIYDLESRETKLLEANPRYWRSLLGSLKAGVNFPHLACLASEGKQFERPAYRNIRYARPEAALRMWTHRWLKKGSTSWSLRDSVFSLILGDPLPDVAIQASRLWMRGKTHP